MTLDDQILELASRKEGMTTADLPNSLRVGHRCARLCNAGKLHRGKVSHKVVRYFTSPLAAAEYVLQSRACRPAPVAVSAKATKFAPDATVDYSRAKITIAPPPPERPLRTNTYSIM